MALTHGTEEWAQLTLGCESGCNMRRTMQVQRNNELNATPYRQRRQGPVWVIAFKLLGGAVVESEDCASIQGRVQEVNVLVA
eukprot:7304603-Alexandrium_andersonii.AAC.1